jgi:hypothetical protein
MPKMKSRKSPIENSIKKNKVRFLKTANFTLYKTLLSWAWWHIAVIPAIGEAEAGGS